MDKAHTARLGALFSRYNNELRRFVARLLANKSDVDDCIQETYLSLWRQEVRGNLRDETKGYLFVTARNVANAIWRKSRRQFNCAELSEYLDLTHNVESEKSLREREAIRLVGKQIDTLKPTTRVIFLMHHVEGLDFEEIADRLGISSRTVERHMARALDHCRATLGDVLKDILE